MFAHALRRSVKPNQHSIMTLWKAAQSVPGGRKIFSRLIGKLAPYTDTIRAEVIHLEAGHAQCRIREHRRIQNHLKSIHAVALVNLIEQTTGLAMLSGTPPGMRGIVTHLEVDYIRKARGVLTAMSHAPKVNENTSDTHAVYADVFDETGHVVCKGIAHWLIAPNPSGKR